MTFNLNKVGGGKSSSGDFKRPDPLDSGSYPARLVQLIDLGVQPQRPYQGQSKPPCQEVYLTYESSDEFLQDEEGNDIEDKPRWISETIPLLPLKAERAKSTQRYKALDPNGVYEGDFSKCLGDPCMMTLVQSVSKKNGNTYNNVAGLSPVSAKQAARMPELVNPTKMFSLEEPDLDIFNSLPEFLQEKIKSNLNFQGSKLQKLLGEKDDDVEEEEEAPKKAPAKKVTPKLAESSEKPAWEEDGDDSPY